MCPTKGQERRGYVPGPKRVWVVAEYGQELHIRGDLMVLLDVESGTATLYRTVETYIEPSQKIIDKWHAAEKPYWVNPETHLFRFLEEVDYRMVESQDEIEEMFDSVEPLQWTSGDC